MQIIKGKTNIDFIGKRRIAILLSTAVNIAIVVGIAGFGFQGIIERFLQADGRHRFLAHVFAAS